MANSSARLGGATGYGKANFSGLPDHYRPAHSYVELSKAEKELLARVQQKYNSRLEWTHFAAWWNAEFNKTGLSTGSPVYRVCQDLEARLGIHRGSVSPPDYRDFLADLIDGRFGSRHAFCQATGVDPGQLSRVFAGRADLSLQALGKVLEVLQARLIIQTEDQAREQIPS